MKALKNISEERSGGRVTEKKTIISLKPLRPPPRRQSEEERFEEHSGVLMAEAVCIFGDRECARGRCGGEGVGAPQTCRVFRTGCACLSLRERAFSASCQLPLPPSYPRASPGFRFSECSCMQEKGWDSCREERSTCVYGHEYLHDFSWNLANRK